MKTFDNYSTSSLAAMSNEEIDTLRDELISHRTELRENKDPHAVAQCLEPTDCLLNDLKKEYQRRARPF